MAPTSQPPQPRRRSQDHLEVTLPSGARMPILGQGTWYMGEDSRAHAQEIRALQAGLDAGTRLIDTAEMYGDGGAEELVGEAIRGRRDETFLVSKVYPFNAGYDDCIAACERSLRRLGTDRLDLYLLHWRGSVPYAETIEAFETLKRDGKLVDYGVSNFDADEIARWHESDRSKGTAVDQVYYSLGERGIEWGLLPWCQEHNLPLMAYAPFDHGRLFKHDALGSLAQELDTQPDILALAWLLSRDQVAAIPKTSRPERATAYPAALELVLSDEVLSALDAAFPPPETPRPLAIL